MFEERTHPSDDEELSIDELRSIRLVLNGAAADDELLREAVGAIRQRGHQVEVRAIWEPGHGRLFAREGAEAGADAVVAAGGDGTLHEVVLGVRDADAQGECALGVLPYGTANDFARARGLVDREPLEILEQIVTTEPDPVDMGVVNGHLFVNVATAGFGAEITSDTPEGIKAALGSAAYVLEGLTSLGDMHPHELEIEAPDFSWSGKALLLAVGNGRLAGGGFQVCPRAELDDGLLDVLIIPEVPQAQFITLVEEVLRLGNHDDYEHAIYHQTPWLEVSSQEPMQLNLDGEPVVDHTFRFETAPETFYLH
jgi:lipid kinase YegS